MIIGIDGNEANIKNRVGVGQYAFNLFWNLYKIDTKNKYIIYLKNQPLGDLPPEKENWTYKVFGPQKLWTKFALPFHIFTQKEKLNLFYSPSHYSPQFCPCPTIPTIHDLGYLQFKDQFNKKDLYQLINWTKNSIKKAKHIVTVSEFSQKEIQRIYNINSKKITVAFNGVDNPPKISIESQKQILKKLKINEPYFLFVGTLKPNKNIPFLIKSFSLFLKSHSSTTLVIAGKKGWLFDEIFKTVKEEKLEDKIIFTDYINETQKWTLYQNAISLIIPSTYEGFGIPAIESLKVGTPVIASNIESLKEVLGESSLFIDPNNPKDLCLKMTLIIDPKNRKKYSELGLKQTQKYTWANTAKSVMEAFDKTSCIIKP